VADTKILVIEDNPTVIRLLKANLSMEGYELLTAQNGIQGLDMAAEKNPDLIILDLVIPEMDGYEVARRIRRFSAVPIIMLTARSSEADIVRGFEAGADDYLTKPFSVKELLVRVRAVLRRSKFPGEIVKRPPLELNGLTIDFAKRHIIVRGKKVSLTPLEYRLLTYLVFNRGRVMLHEEILRNVWGEEYRDEVDYLRVYIRYLRQKIEKEPSNPEYIITKSGVGYMFQVPNEESAVNGDTRQT
jgi:two-component system KDP operon response regulator KdpE